MAFRRTAVIINLDGRSKLAALAELTAPLAVQVADLHDLPAALRKMLAGENDGQLVAELQADIDRHFDRIAVIIERSAASRPDREAHPHTRGAALVAELRALRLAHSVRGRQMVAERSALGSALEAQRRAVAELEARLSAVAEQLATQADERRRIDAEYLRVLAARDELATAHHEQFHDRERAQRQVAEVHADLGLAHARIEQLLSELAAERASASGELASAQASSASAAQRRDELAQQLALTEGALSALQRTKTFRVANLPRRVYGRLRR
jgi:chromosome segregation ATPase